jgi:tRNA (guanine-N7-)-methyltransferase
MRTMPDSHPPSRPIRSYVLRQGRLTAGQERAFAELWPRYGVEIGSGPLDLAALFGNANPVWLEIGFGNGETLLHLAAAHPDRNYLGVEVHRPGVGHLLLRLDAAGIGNVRVIRHDAVEVLRDEVQPGSLAGVYLFFPDPWHKTRHHKRRIVRPELVELLARTIVPGGVFHAATDWEDYARHMLQVLDAADDLFENTAGAGNYAPRPEERPETRFERRGQRLGHGVWDLVFRRRALD